MAVIAPVTDTFTVETIDSRSVDWPNIRDGDTVTPHEVPGTAGINGNIHIVGTLGGAKVTLLGSNDGANFLPLRGLDEYKIATRKEALLDFSTAARWIIPEISGGVDYDFSVFLVLR